MLFASAAMATKPLYRTCSIRIVSVHLLAAALATPAQDPRPGC